ncbi:MAG: alcohol dehydrogenase catalytic domain-containing protein [Actinobacteria bacterium]|nr:alcohol dehydrogenase catalytic domain-containing protein [Actinomycetota bacterium]
MRAARLWGRGDLRVEEVPDPGSPPAGWVLVRIEACGICGTDVEEFTAGPNIVPTEPHPLTGRCVPLTLGHEAVGVVEEVGPEASLEPGMRVAVEANMFCGECWWCHRHEYQLCPKLASLGLMADGGLAERMLAPAYMCIPFADHVAAEAAALAEPLAVVVRAARRGELCLGSTVGIVGAGTIGLLAVQTARIVGARRVLVVERLEQRRRLALELGADAAVSPEEAAEVGLELTEGIGLDVTIEAAGNPAAAVEAVRLARPGGRAVLLGVFDAPVPVDMMDLLLGEKQILASLSHVYDTDFATAVSLIERGQVETAPLITDRILLDDVVEKGFKVLVTEADAHLKIIVTPNGHHTG